MLTKFFRKQDPPYLEVQRYDATRLRGRSCNMRDIKLSTTKPLLGPLTDGVICNRPRP